MASHNDHPFSTYDKDNDQLTPTNCAKEFYGAWWYHSCHESNLNGRYFDPPVTHDGAAMCWRKWKDTYESLLKTEMKVRPKIFKT